MAKVLKTVWISPKALRRFPVLPVLLSVYVFCIKFNKIGEFPCFAYILCMLLLYKQNSLVLHLMWQHKRQTESFAPVIVQHSFDTWLYAKCKRVVPLGINTDDDECAFFIQLASTALDWTYMMNIGRNSEQLLPDAPNETRREMHSFDLHKSPSEREQINKECNFEVDPKCSYICLHRRISHCFGNGWYLELKRGTSKKEQKRTI